MRGTPKRDRGDGRATGQPQGLQPEAYFFSTSQGSRPEDAREDGQIRDRSRWLVHSAGYVPFASSVAFWKAVSMSGRWKISGTTWMYRTLPSRSTMITERARSMIFSTRRPVDCPKAPSL